MRLSPKLRRSPMTRAATGIALLALVGGCSGPEAPTYPGGKEIPTIKLELEDGITEVDFACDGDSVLHVVFIAEMRDSVKAGRKQLHLWYERGNLVAGTWSEPKHLAAVELGRVRVVRVGPDLHVIAPGPLRDFVSRDDGNIWRELPPLLGEGHSSRFDTGALGNTLLVAFAAHASSGDSFTVTALETDFKSKRSSQIARLQGDELLAPDPRMVVSADGADLFCGTTEARLDTTTTNGQREIIGHTRPRAFHASRGSKGVWKTEEIGPLLRRGPGIYAGPPIWLEGLDATRSHGRWLVFWVNAFLYAMAQRADGSWAEGVPVAHQPEGVLNRSYLVRSIGCDGDSDGVVAWVDTRFVKKGGTDINPIGGLPGAPSNWSSTDALALRIGQVPGGPAALLRLTHPSAYVDQLRVRAGRSKIFVLWSGRSKVGNRLAEYGARPSLFYTSVPKE